MSICDYCLVDHPMFSLTKLSEKRNSDCIYYIEGIIRPAPEDFTGLPDISQARP